MTDQLPPYRHTAERLAQLEAEVQRLQSLEIAFNALEQHAEQHIAELEATVKRLETMLLRQEVLLDAIQGLEAQLAAQSNIVKIEEGVAWIKQGDSWVLYSSKQ